jgi:hypothetical protein
MGTIDVVGFLGLIATTVSKKGDSVTTLVVIDEAAYYGYGPTRRRSRSLPSSGCDNFFGEVVAAFECPDDGETVKVDQGCKEAAETTYELAIDVAQGEYDRVFQAAQVVYEAAKVALIIVKARKYAVVVEACALTLYLPARVVCMAAGAVAIEVEAAAIKKAFEEALDLAIETALNNLDTIFAGVCSVAKASANACVYCEEESCGNPAWSCGTSLTQCGSGGLGGLCVCDLDTDGIPFCWANTYCSGLKGCSSSVDCLGGSRCFVGTCCGGGVCLSSCGGRRLENRGLDIGAGMTAAEM